MTEPSPSVLISRVVGWVAGENRQVETWSAPPGLLLRVEGGSDFYIAPGGQTIIKAADFAQKRGTGGGLSPPSPVSPLDHDILLGPALVLALALRDVWSLHASANLFQGKTIAFLGESGRGKSTLAAYLSSSPGWRLVADDILPVKMAANGVLALPHFPQLKLPAQRQPAIELPEQLPLDAICVLEQAEPDQMPELQTISATQGMHAWLRHVAGTRMFDATLLKKHLEFSALAAAHIPAYRLIHPHRRDTLPLVRELWERICSGPDSPL